jgi:hypothetical protein
MRFETPDIGQAAKAGLVVGAGHWVEQPRRSHLFSVRTHISLA